MSVRSRFYQIFCAVLTGHLLLIGILAAFHRPSKNQRAAPPTNGEMQSVQWLDLMATNPLDLISKASFRQQPQTKPQLPLKSATSQASPRPKTHAAAKSVKPVVPPKAKSARPSGHPVAKSPPLGKTHPAGAVAPKASPPASHARALPHQEHPSATESITAHSPPEWQESPKPSVSANLSASADGLSEDELADYHNHIQSIFERHWHQPRGGMQTQSQTSPTARICLLIGRNGQISGQALVQSSGNAQVDESALAAARSVPRIDPLPSGIPGDSYRVIIKFELH